MKRLLCSLACLLLASPAMAGQLQQSTVYTRAFFMVASADHVTALTGATVTCSLSKAGGSFSAAAGTVTEIGNGWYKIALTTGDTNTTGDLAYHCGATSADFTDFADQVFVNALGNVNVAQWNSSTVGALQAFPSNFSAFVVDASGRVDLSKVNGNTINDLISGRVDANTQAVAASLTTNITGNLSGSVGSVTGAVGSVTTVSDKTGYSLTAGEHTLIGADVGSRVAEAAGGFTYDQIMRIMFAILAGRTHSGGTVFKTPDDSVTRGTFTIDTSNNRTSVTLTP